MSPRSSSNIETVSTSSRKAMRSRSCGASWSSLSTRIRHHRTIRPSSSSQRQKELVKETTAVGSVFSSNPCFPSDARERRALGRTMVQLLMLVRSLPDE